MPQARHRIAALRFEQATQQAGKAGGRPPAFESSQRTPTPRQIIGHIRRIARPVRLETGGGDRPELAKNEGYLGKLWPMDSGFSVGQTGACAKEENQSPSMRPTISPKLRLIPGVA